MVNAKVSSLRSSTVSLGKSRAQDKLTAYQTLTVLLLSGMGALSMAAPAADNQERGVAGVDAAVAPLQVRIAELEKRLASIDSMVELQARDAEPEAEPEALLVSSKHRNPQDDVNFHVEQEQGWQEGRQEEQEGQGQEIQVQGAR